MAIKLEFINIIIPVAKIKEKTDFDIEAEMLPDIDWHDAHLYRTGAMNPLDVDDIVEDWAVRGLTPFIVEDGLKKWNDLCVIDTVKGLNWPCEWIEVDLSKRCAWLKGTDKDSGVIIGPEGRDPYEGVVL